MIRALILSMSADPNAEGYRFKAAADRHGGASIRAVTRSTHGFKRLPSDILLAGNRGAVERLWADADVVHLNNSWAGHDEFGKAIAKPALLHHHGLSFRVDPEPFLRRAERAGWTQAASTLDLAEVAPDAVTWLPTAYDLDALAELRRQHRRPDDGMVRIAHAPTFRQIKGTKEIEAAVEVLQSEGLPVELDVIERVSWQACMRRKAAADIFVDQLLLGYGCNAVEAWGMGLPVVAGIDPERAAWVNHPIPATTRGRMLSEFGSLPFVEATVDTVVDVLRELVTDPARRQAAAVRGMEHVARFHAQLPALERLVSLYQRTIGKAVA